MNALKTYRWFFLALSLTGYILLGYFTPRTEFYQLISLFFLLFGSYFFLLYAFRESPNQRLVISFGVVFRFALLFCIPALSDDFYRFVWDGRMTVFGDNPFQHLPKEMLNTPRFLYADHALYEKLNSPGYYSVYPPLMQYVFAGAAKLFPILPVDVNPKYFWQNVVAMKSVIFLAEIGSIFLLFKIGKALKQANWLPAIYVLNPLVIVELTGNLHFEALMIFFLLLALWLLIRNRWLLSAGAFSLAVSTKILPLMLLPFLVKRLGWKKAFVYSLIVFAAFLVLFLPFYEQGVIANYFSSLALYFRSFEFNANLYYLVREVAYCFVDYNIIPYTAFVLPVLVAAMVLWLAMREKQPNYRSLFRVWLLAFAVYFLFATTVNPWYIAVMVMLAVFSGFRFPLLWSALIPLSYFTYRTAAYEENLWLVAVQYVPVFMFAFYELGWLNKPLRWWALKRAAVKWKRLKNYYQKGERVLDIGSGNGALSYLIRQNEIEVQALDVKDKSLFNEVRPVIYKGQNFPFGKDEFDVAQMITMLHHTPKPKVIIEEAMRVSQRLIIMEDIYTNPFQKYLTFFMDSLVNLEFIGHPHTNKTDAEWRELFTELGLEIKEVKYHRFLVVFRQVTYYLERK